MASSSSFAATPQRPLPGAYFATPAPNRPSNALQRTTAQPQASALPPTGTSVDLTSIQRAAKTINDTLAQEKRYPELDSYVTQGISSDYDLSQSPAWAPFQKLRSYDIPDRVFEQYNQAQVSTMMGLFAELNHAWITIDNALYMWDYTSPNPELVGFEDQPNSITAVKLVVPRPGVFVDKITHLLLVATTSDIYLLGLACTEAGEGVKQLSLYQTRMQLSVRGIDVCALAASTASGRIFFGGRASNDLYELTYQQEDKWFAGKCGKVNHTTSRLSSLVPDVTQIWKETPLHEYVTQIAIDDTRHLVYTLSSLSTIRVFYMTSPTTLDLVITRTYDRLNTNISHMINRSDLIGPKTSIVVICPISSKESSRLNLVAVTSTGCRIFLSATTGAYYSNVTAAPSSMQVHHVKFPPTDGSAPSSNQTNGTYGGPVIDTNSRLLCNTRLGSRYPPGYFLSFVQRNPNDLIDHLFVSAPDSGRIGRPHEQAQVTKYAEFGLWMNLSGRAEDVGLVTPAFSAASSPAGFGNELSVQFDQPATELAILTNSGVETIRRRRLVDIFAAAIRHGGGDDGLEGEINKFVRLYGRSETTATALAVACGQGLDSSSDSFTGRNNDQDILEYSTKAFIEFGGKANYNENSLLDANASPLDNVQPSPRHEGIALYISRLIRSAWKVPIWKESTPAGSLVVTPTVPIEKLRGIQKNLNQLQQFLESNRSFIDGLNGPEAGRRANTKQEEIALQGEHRALESLMHLISNIVEGLAFVQVLFEEQVEDIILSLEETPRQQCRELTFEVLFASSNGKMLAKELVKAIVSRNILSGSSIDTVADALRRRCGRFCSPEDVIMFKAQEQIKRAQELGSQSENGRILLNESLKLFERVADSLGTSNIDWATQQYLEMCFYAGAIRLALRVAQARDRANQALTWQNEGQPAGDKRARLFSFRETCYELVTDVIAAVDRAAAAEPENDDGQLSLMAKREREAYQEVNNSTDKLFQDYLYNYYMKHGLTDRILQTDSEYITEYLSRKSSVDIRHADLLWQYYARRSAFFDAAIVQLQLAKSDFDLSLDQRTEYLSRARTNASARTSALADFGGTRQSRQQVLREITDLLDIGSIQGELLQRIRADPRLSDQRRPEVIKELDGQIQPVDGLYHKYADQAQYHDMCLLIYFAADMRNSSYIEATWKRLIEEEHARAAEAGHPNPWEIVADKVRSLGLKLNKSETFFPAPFLLHTLLAYAITEFPASYSDWTVDLFLFLNFPPDIILNILERILYDQEPPFNNRSARSVVAVQIVRVSEAWFEKKAAAAGSSPSSPSATSNGIGADDAAVSVEEVLKLVVGGSAGGGTGNPLLNEAWAQRARLLRARIERVLR